MSLDQPGVMVLTGISAAGKSSVAQLLAERLSRSAHVRGDAFRRMVVAGRHDMTAEPSEEAVRQLRLRYRIGALAADAYAEAGFTAVLQDVAVGPVLSDLVDAVRTRPRWLVVLAPTPEVVAQRERYRPKSAYLPGAPSIADLDLALRNDTPRLGLWLDTSEQAPHQTVEEILRRAPEALVP